jgi:hypothetical protein
VSFRVASGKFDIESQSVCFHLDDGTNIVPCTVAGQVLLDLADHYFLSCGTMTAAFSLLLPEVERLVNAKYGYGRLEENGELVIGTADLLRYGFQKLCPSM